MPIRIILESKDSPLPPKQKKTSILVIGRFQPPTKGHGHLINAAKKAWREYKYDAIIVCIVDGKETSKNKKKNPLSGDSRKFYLEHSNYSKGLQFVIVGSAFEAFIKSREMGYEPMAVVGGKFVNDKKEDRPKGYKELLDKYFKNDDGSEIEHKAVTLERDPEAEGIESVSASTVRAAVMSNLYDDFKDLTDLENEKLTRKMFDEMQASMSNKEVK
jgi:nicotinamide mononucleotide adenylyltransferase